MPKRFFGAGVPQWRIKRMKTNLSFLRNTTHIFLLAAVTLLLLSARSLTFAGSATWDSSGSTDWNTSGNWLPSVGGYPGITLGDTATFDNLSSVTSLFVSPSPADNSLDGI